MANSKIGCNSGRVTIIDPNHFGGMDSSSNIPVNNEDLNISVILTTYKKGRTILTANSDNSKKNSFNTQGTVSINFIDGSDINGKKVLTTNYTDLTTLFDDNTTNNAGEGLGITNIDIDFNSQQSPMITINFVDVRGSAIFQNEENITDGKNKYSTFFQLPYPLFKLTIKGYYGLPVEYCLHMYKFNSKFNSQTGNFEITANFIGFTYAMLSDMLIGYLKAIPFTKIGKAKYEEINDIRRKNGNPEIMTLNTLMVAISLINDSIKKISADDIDAIEVSNVEKKFDNLSYIKDILAKFCSKLDIRGITTEPYSLVCKPDTYEVEVDKILAEYKDEMDKAIIAFNENSNIQLDVTNFDMSLNTNGYGYSNYTSKKFRDDINKNSTNINATKLVNNDLDTLEFNKIKNDAICSFWVITQTNRIISETSTQLENARKAARTNLGKKARDLIKSKLFLDPTMRNIIEIFTTAVEVFMESIYQVSADAEANTNILRNEQLKSKFLVQENVDIKNVLPSDDSILAWPGYRERKDLGNKEAYVEKYLGTTKPEKILDIPTNVDEIRFVDDLLDGFIKAAAQTDIANEINNESETSWFPINPVDTRLFGITEAPYSRIGKNGFSSHLEVANLMLIRAMTFLGYNNLDVSKPEIEQMAEIDTMSMINSVTDTKLKLALSMFSVSDFIKLKGNVNNLEKNIIEILNTNDYTYYYFPDYTDNYSLKIIPINDGFSGKWTLNSNSKIWEFEGPTKPLFLTNYNNYDNKNNKKINDGGTYIKIFSSKDYDAVVNLDNRGKPEKVDINNNIIKLEIIKNTISGANSATQLLSANYNVFGGPYGIQEFKNMDWGEDELTDLKLPLRYVFFDEGTQRKGSFFSMSTVNKVFEGLRINISIRGLAKRESTSTTMYDLDTFNGIQLNTSKRNSGKTSYFDDSTTNSWDSVSVFSNVFTDMGNNRSIMAQFDPSTTSYPFVEMKYKVNLFTGDEATYYFSLFGSRLYYGQSLSKYPLYAKGLLFLSTLPWNGAPLEKPEILQLFNKRAGFVHVPKLWAAYVGGIFFQLNTKKPIYSPSDASAIIGGGAGSNGLIVWKKTKTDVLGACKKNNTKDMENWNNMLRSSDLNDYYSNINNQAKNLPDVLLNLPNQVKEEFIKIFLNFIDRNAVTINDESDNDFKKLNSLVELVPDGSIDTFDTNLKNLYGKLPKSSSKQSNFFYTDTVNITNNFKHNIDKYQTIIPLLDDDDLEYQINLMFKGTAEDLESPVGIIVSMISEEVIIANSGFHIWETVINNPKNKYWPIFTNKQNFEEIYFKKVVEILKLKCSSSSISAEIKKKEQEIFGTSDVDAIKFQLYKTCKNINDKWLGGVNNKDNIIYQCGGGRGSVDLGLKTKYRKGDEKFRLIDSFRFVDRAFRDIGDLFYLNPIPVNDYLINSPTTSMFDAVSQLLASNNFTFIPLPTFINYNDQDTLKEMFEVNPNYNEIKDTVCGPSFVAVYAGDSSKHLDFGDNEYPNDGIDFQCDGNNNVSTTVPIDFVGTSNDFENDVAVFSVNYSQQNQNIFKDITLDQSEFSETDESLKINDDIANKGGQNNVSLGGQNIYNVYSVRSYKAEVEMMGNPMIQPMMHFQLNNIPMFHGAYLITRVKHSIKPNYMSTVFSGSRVRYQKTDLLTGSDFYMGIIDSMELSANASNTTGTVGSSLLNGYFNDLKSNIPKNKIIEGSVISNKLALTQRGEKEISNWQDGKINEKNGVDFLNEYAKATPVAGLGGEDYTTSKHPWSAIFVSYIMLAGDSNFPKSPQHFMYITAAMDGKYGYEAFALNSGLKIKPEVGDIICQSRPEGGPQAAHCNVLYKTTTTVATFAGGNLSSSGKRIDIKLDGGYITDSTNVSEMTIYIKKTNNKYYNNKKIIGTGTDNTSGKLETGTNADYWSLVALCALENTTPIGRCDVAQSIYNRLLSKIYSKGTIKELIVDDRQYEPVSRAKNEFLGIKNKETAIIAYQKSKKVTNDVARKNIEETNTSLNDTKLVNNSKSFVGGRTDFYSNTIKDRIPINGRNGLVERENQIFGWFVGPSAITYGQNNPTSANKPDFSNVA